MQRKIWNKKTIPTSRLHGPWISIQPGSGKISFTCELVDKLKLNKAGIEFIQDEEKPKEWYIEISNSPDAIKLREEKNNVWAFQSTYLARTILDSLELDKGTYKIPVAIVPAEKNLYAILTKGAAPTLVKKPTLKRQAA